MFRQLKEAGWSLEQPPTRMLRELAERCMAAGADGLEINVQQRHDQPEAMEFAVNTVQQVSDRQLCLSTNSAKALEAGLRACKHPPLVNYVSIDKNRLETMLPLIARHGAEAVLLITDPAMPGDAQEMLEKAAILVGAANEVGISNDSLLIDPGLFHITTEVGQRHLIEVTEFLRALPEVFDPPVRSTCWLGNISAGAPDRLRPVIETTLLAMFSALGLSCAFLDVLSRENMQTVRLIKILRNEVIYSDSDVEL